MSPSKPVAIALATVIVGEDPIDISDDRFISIRVQMPEQSIYI